VECLYGAPFVKILYLTDLAQKVLSLGIYSYLCTDLIISACRDVISARDSYLCMKRVEGKHGILSEEKLGVLFQ